MDPIGKKRTAEVPVVPSSPSLAHDLEALRDCVLLRLETIEDLARRRCGNWSAEINRLEQALKERTDELEQERMSIAPTQTATIRAGGGCTPASRATASS